MKSAIDKTATHFGGIDIVVNNASAMSRTPVAETDMKRYDLMQAINARGTFMVSKYAIPHLEKAANPHILMSAPPLDMQEKWFAGSTGYSIAKFGMSLVALGLAGELRGRIAVNALWPRSTIATAAIKNLLGGERVMRMSRTPEIMADAAYAIFHKPAKTLHRPLPDRRHVSLWRRRQGLREVPRDAGRAAGRDLLRAGPSAAAARRRDQREKVGLSASAA